MPIVVGVVVSVVIVFGGIIIHVILWRRKTGTTLQIPSGKVSIISGSND